jgi:hypothetical protein
MKKEIDFAARMQYWRIFYNLTPSCVIFGTAFFFLIGWKAIPLAIIINILLPFPLMMLAEYITQKFVSFLMGEKYQPVPEEKLIEGELTRAKYLTRNEQFNAALQSTNRILEQDQNHPQALLLKARILSQGFANHAGAKNCLEKIMFLQSAPDEAFKATAQDMIEEMTAHLQKCTDWNKETVAEKRLTSDDKAASAAH